MNNGRFKLGAKDIGYIITLIGIIVAFFVRFALVEAKVEEHDQQLEDHNLMLIEYQLTEISEKQDDISGKLDELEHLILSFHGQ